MGAIFLVINLFFALWIRQIFVNRSLEQIILKYYIQYGFLPFDDEVPRIINDMEERAYRNLVIKSKIEKIKQLFKRK